MPLAVRPGQVLPPIDLDHARAEVDTKTWRAVTDHEFASYLMYPKVFLDYMSDRLNFGPVRVLPTTVYFYGMEPGAEVAVELERGKTLIIRFVAVSEAHEDGTRTAFFELNGQPRAVKVPDRGKVAIKPPRRKADTGNVSQIGAPMPGTVATVCVSTNSKVAKGDVLVTLEAMKMETSVRADRDATVAEVVARPGETVDAKDLLIVLA
jgi:pyruvate carboxylase